MLLLLSFGFLIVLAVLLLSIWSTVRAYNVKHTIDPPEDASKGLTSFLTNHNIFSIRKIKG